MRFPWKLYTDEELKVIDNSKHLGYLYWSNTIRPVCKEKQYLLFIQFDKRIYQNIGWHSSPLC